jgi:VanZ family protein
MFAKHMRWSLSWAILILILCAIPGRDLPQISALELLNFDKFVHALLFFVLILLTVNGFKRQASFALLYRSPKIISLFLCVIYGGLLEIMQGAVFSERTADIFDFIANSFGCTVGIMAFDSMETKLFGKISSK